MNTFSNFIVVQYFSMISARVMLAAVCSGTKHRLHLSERHLPPAAYLKPYIATVYSLMVLLVQQSVM